MEGTSAQPQVPQQEAPQQVVPTFKLVLVGDGGTGKVSVFAIRYFLDGHWISYFSDHIVISLWIAVVIIALTSAQPPHRDFMTNNPDRPLLSSAT